MKNFFLICLFWSFSMPGQCQQQDTTKPFPANVKRILFLGNSITYQGDYITDLEACITVLYPKKHFEFINAGLPSETVSGLSEDGHANGAFPRPDLHERLARVLALTNPDLVFADYGMNDAIYQPFDQERFQRFKSGISWLHDEVDRSGVDIIFLTPPVYDEKKGGVQGYNGVLDAYSRWLLSLHDSLNWKVADIHFPMADFLQERRTTDPDFTLASDGVHPGDLGHWFMAKQVLLYLDKHAPLLSAGDITQALAPYRNGLQILKLVNQRQQMMKDAWLSASKHNRPGMNPGLPLDEAKAKGTAIETQIRKMLK